MTTLDEHLRALADDGLAALLRLRTDLVVPVPADLSALAARAQARVSVARALDPLDRFVLEILDALRLSRDETGVTSVSAVLALTAQARPSVDQAQVRAAIDRLRALFIVYGDPDELSIVAGVDEVCPPYPAGLGRPAAELDPDSERLCADAAGLRRTLLAAPPASRAVLDRLAAGPPVGTAASGAMADPSSPVGWLVSRHLLVAAGGDTVQLPREVALLLRRDVGPLGALHPTPPTAEAPLRAVKAVDSAGAGQALEIVRQTEVLLAALGVEASYVLKSGGMGSRDLRRLARAAGIEDASAGVLVEVAAAAGLLGETDPESLGEPRFLPTGGYDHWRNMSIAAQWSALARGWLALGRQPGLIGKRDERDSSSPAAGTQKARGALSPELERTGAAQIRVAALRVMAAGGPGAVPDVDGVLSVLAWRSPRRYGRSADYGEAVRAALSEAALLGMTGLGALTGYGRLLLDEMLAAAARDPDEDPLGITGDPVAASVAALDGLLPAPVDHVLVQADLTVVVPGPPEPALAADLAAVADSESANMFRVTQNSVRRALDAGYSASELHALFARRSRTPIPQALSYLVDDVARRHGGLRGGSAGAYLRSDDEALIAELVADRRLTDLRLRRLAPTVLVSPLPENRLLAALREAGHAPVAEDAAGSAVLTRIRALRAPVRRPAGTIRSIVDGQVPVPWPRLAGIVDELRRAETVARMTRRAPVGLRMNGGGSTQGHIEAMAILQQALRDKQRVWVGYVDAHGGTAARLVRPVSIGAGFLRAEDDRTETLHTFALHRITAAVVDQS